MIKNGIYFIVIALLLAELFKILIYADYVTCDVTMLTQSGVKSQKIEYLPCFLYKTGTLYSCFTQSFIVSTVTFPWQHNGLQALSIQRENQSFPPSRSVICYCCSFSRCARIWT